MRSNRRTSCGRSPGFRESEAGREGRDGLKAGGEASGARRGGFPMNTEIIDAGRDINGGYKVDVSRGTNVDRVSSEWFSRPDDERYLSLDDLFASVKGRA